MGHTTYPVVVWVFPNIVVPQKAWFIMENPIKIHDLGVPVVWETPIYNISSYGPNGQKNCLSIRFRSTFWIELNRIDIT